MADHKASKPPKNVYGYVVDIKDTPGITKWCKDRKYNLVGVYSDPERLVPLSHKYRPKLESILCRVKRGDMILVSRYTSLTTSFNSAVEIDKTVTKNGACIMFMESDRRTDTPEGRVAFMVAMALIQNGARSVKKG
jgi:hypothetical protein